MSGTNYGVATRCATEPRPNSQVVVQSTAHQNSDSTAARGAGPILPTLVVNSDGLDDSARFHYRCDAAMPQTPLWRVAQSRLAQALLAVSRERQLLAAWLVLRVLTGLVAIVASSLRPLTVREVALPLWPPAYPLGMWLERVLLAPWERLDST